MSLELVNTLATCATFVVIAATAIAAIVQLRQLRASNQIVAFNELSRRTRIRTSSRQKTRFAEEEFDARAQRVC